MNSIAQFITERNLELKESGKKFGFIYPAYYNVGMGGMTISALSNIVNNYSNWSFERFFLPRNPSVETLSVESKSTLSKMDLLGFTSQFELDYLTVLWLLKKAKYKSLLAIEVNQGNLVVHWYKNLEAVRLCLR